MTRTATLSLCVLVLAPVPSRAAEAERTPLSADLLWQIRRLGNPSLSPDGQWAVVPLNSYDVKADKALTDLWLVPTTPGEARQLTSHEGSETSPAWSPDGKYVAFEAKRGDDENPQIYVIPLGGGEARRLTNLPTGASAPKWFPDSRRLAFVSRVWADLPTWDEMAKRQKERKDAKMTARVFDQAPIRYWDHWLDDRQAHLYTTSLTGDEPKAVTRDTGLELSKQEVGTSSFDISPEGTEIAFAANVDKTGTDANFDVFTIPADGGPAQNVTALNKAADQGPLYSPDGRYLAFGRQTIKHFYADRVRLVLHDRTNGTNRVVTEAFDRSVGDLAFARDGQSVYAAIDDAAQQRVYRIDLATGQANPVTKDKSFSALELSKDGTVLVALRQSFVEPPTLVRIDTGTGEATKLSTFNDALFEKVAWGAYESVSYKGSGGKDVQMWVNYPPGFDRSKKHPVYLLLHGGPHGGVTDSFTFRWNAQVFSGWGYVAHAAVYDLYNMVGSDGGASQPRFGGYWEKERDALYRKMSPHFGAQRFKTPTLVIQGGLDYRVPDTNGIEVFHMLQQRGVKSRLVYYPNENHWILKPQNSLFWYQSTRDWLKELIGEGPDSAPRAAGGTK